METVFFARIDSGFDFGNILPHRGADVARFGKEILGKFRNVAAGNAESVMHHEDLPVGDVARADADHWNGQSVGDALRQFNRHALQDQQLRTRRLQR